MFGFLFRVRHRDFKLSISNFSGLINRIDSLQVDRLNTIIDIAKGIRLNNIIRIQIHWKRLKNLKKYCVRAP